jgi:hypothetical protein
MSDWLERFRHCEVEIIYLTDSNVYRDRGKMRDFDTQWIELETSGKRETFLVPVSAIRLMKVLSPPDKVENLLLRPVDAMPPQEIESEEI